LPAKVLLPINGIPLAVLAAKRASNTGKNIIVAISNEPSDDALYKTLSSYKLKCYRGSLVNTLERFVNALSAYDDDAIVFRLTADNVFPDGELLDEMEKEFVSRKLDYLCCNGEKSGLPYGMSVEVTLLKNIREAYLSTSDKLDLEHVTPYIRRTKGEVYFEKYKALAKGNYRCTIDTLDDYINIQKVFDNVNDPINETAFNLVEKLELLKSKPISKKPIKRLIIGGAQLGLNYGIANKTGQPNKNVAELLLKTAINNGVEYIDTANAYGNSESVIGGSLKQGWESRVKIITKLSPLKECPSDASVDVVKAYVEASVYKSCAMLNQNKLDCLMLHRATQLREWKGAVMQVLLSMLREGVVGALGVSVQTPDELIDTLERPEITFIQMPFNILDSRWRAGIKKLQNRKKERILNVHVRSALLQGLLVSDDDILWKRANCNESKEIIHWLNDQVEKNERQSVLDLCLAYVRSQDWVDGVVVGMETMEQLINNIELFSTPLLNNNLLENIVLNRPSLSEEFLNPAKWRQE